MLLRWLEHPLTRGLDPDDPRTTELRRAIIRDKAFLRRIYIEWYRSLAEALPRGPGPVLEIGSGPGFMAEVVPGVITSDMFAAPGVNIVLDALHLPFCSGTLRGIVMTNVLHHLPAAPSFFREAVRCVRPGGAIAMIEPWVTRWSRLVYVRWHHEPFEPQAERWEFPSTGPLSGANGALPWILFERDRAIFERRYPELTVESVVPILPFRYLLSGGVTTRASMPDWTSPFWSGLESLLGRRRASLAMFARVVLRRVA